MSKNKLLRPGFRFIDSDETWSLRRGIMLRSLMLLLCVLAFSTRADAAPAKGAPSHVIIITMENKDAVGETNKKHSNVYGNMSDAPYINGVLSLQAARANNFVDELSELKSQPHYILMEAGRTKFEDADFTCNEEPLEVCNSLLPQRNWTESREHLTAQIEAARDPALTWMTYQEGIDPKTTGACPIHSAGLYAAKHNPFIYFADVAGSPPSTENAYCISHTRDLNQFMIDMQKGSLANYVFITPNLCNDMHGADGCRTNPLKAGDVFLRSFLQPVLAWAELNEAVVFVVWDESHAGKSIPFFAAGRRIKANYQNDIQYSHRSVLKTIERIFGLPFLDSVKDANDLSDMFEPGVLP